MCSRETSPSSSRQTRGKRQEVGRADSEALNKYLIDGIESGVYIIQSSKFVYVNPFFTRLTGYSREELIGMRAFKLVHPEDRPTVRKKAIRSLKNVKSARPYEYRFLKKNGDLMWILERVSPIEYKGQKATLGNFMDITRRKKAEEFLAHSEERYRTILEQMHDAYFEVDLAGNFTFVNDSVCNNLGYSIKEITGKHYRFTTPPEDIKPLLLAFNEVFRTGIPNIGFAHGILRKDGSRMFVESSISLRKNGQGEVIGFRSVSRDVTERKRLEGALVKSEERYRTILEQMQDSYCEVDLAGNYTFANESTGFSFGYSQEELIGNNYHLTVPEEDLKGVFAAFNETYRTGKPNSGFTHRIRRKDGSIIVSEVSIDLSRNEQGEVVGFKCLSRDITERKRMENALILEKQFSDAVIDSLPGLFYMLDEKGKFIRWNRNFEIVIGCSSEELSGMNATAAFAEEDRELVAGKILEAFSKGKANVEAAILTKSGQKIPHYLTGVRMEIGDRTYLVGEGIDITERLQLQQKLEEMATHDFLTGLPNRVLLLDRFTIAAALAKRNKTRLAVMSLDLDKFKSINDTLGHEAGDHVLKEISSRLTARIRASDTLARVGGDEFTLVMMGINHVDDAAAIAQKILDAFIEPLFVGGHRLNLSTSIGIAIYPEDAMDLETLTKKSDAAMYFAKGHGRNQFKFFSDGDVKIGGDHRSATTV